MNNSIWTYQVPWFVKYCLKGLKAGTEKLAGMNKYQLKTVCRDETGGPNERDESTSC
jgi:hypothetical protein